MASLKTLRKTRHVKRDGDQGPFDLDLRRLCHIDQVGFDRFGWRLRPSLDQRRIALRGIRVDYLEYHRECRRDLGAVGQPEGPHASKGRTVVFDGAKPFKRGLPTGWGHKRTGDRCINRYARPNVAKLDRFGQAGTRPMPDSHELGYGVGRPGDDCVAVYLCQRAPAITTSEQGSGWSSDPVNRAAACLDQGSVAFGDGFGVDRASTEQEPNRLEGLAFGSAHPHGRFPERVKWGKPASGLDLTEVFCGDEPVEKRAGRWTVRERHGVDSKDGACGFGELAKSLLGAQSSAVIDDRIEQRHGGNRRYRCHLGRSRHGGRVGSSFHLASARANACPMPWRRMRLRNAEVFARCDGEGELTSNGGRVEIRYKPNDGRAYFASVSNLSPTEGPIQIEPDSFCGEAESVQQGKKPSKKKSANVHAPETPEKDELLVYADGACSGNPGPAGVGVVALWDDQRRELSEYIGEATNNIAELTGILRALELAHEVGKPLRLYTDSKYAMGVLTEGWKAKANKELIAEIQEWLDGHPDTKLFHVRGHQGITLNEVADELAVQAVTSRVSTGWVSR